MKTFWLMVTFKGLKTGTSRSSQTSTNPSPSQIDHPPKSQSLTWKNSRRFAGLHPQLKTKPCQECRQSSTVCQWTQTETTCGHLLTPTRWQSEKQRHQTWPSLSRWERLVAQMKIPGLCLLLRVMRWWLIRTPWPYLKISNKTVSKK